MNKTSKTNKTSKAYITSKTHKTSKTYKTSKTSKTYKTSNIQIYQYSAASSLCGFTTLFRYDSLRHITEFC